MVDDEVVQAGMMESEDGDQKEPKEMQDDQQEEVLDPAILREREKHKRCVMNNIYNKNLQILLQEEREEKANV